MKSLKDLTVDLGRLQQKCDEAMKVAPAIIGNMVAQDIKANFMRQGVQTDQGLRKWKPSEAAQKEGRRTLVKSAALMNEVHFVRPFVRAWIRGLFRMPLDTMKD